MASYILTCDKRMATFCGETIPYTIAFLSMPNLMISHPSNDYDLGRAVFRTLSLHLHGITND